MTEAETETETRRSVTEITHTHCRPQDMLAQAIAKHMRQLTNANVNRG